jgi:hypothetical protein
MTLIVKVAVFILGVYLSIRLIAALYGILDLWYTIRTAYPKIIRGILGWGILIVAIGLILNSHYRSPFLWGIVAFLAFHVGFIWLNKLLALRAVRSARMKDAHI